jgi:hypothetical protein
VEQPVDDVKVLGLGQVVKREFVDPLNRAGEIRVDDESVGFDRGIM